MYICKLYIHILILEIVYIGYVYIYIYIFGAFICRFLYVYFCRYENTCLIAYQCSPQWEESPSTLCNIRTKYISLGLIRPYKNSKISHFYSLGWMHIDMHTEIHTNAFFWSLVYMSDSAKLYVLCYYMCINNACSVKCYIHCMCKLNIVQHLARDFITIPPEQLHHNGM